MPRPPKRRASTVASEVVFIGGVEVISVDIVAGKTFKKRAFEKAWFETPVASNNSPPPDNDTRDDTPTVITPKAPSRSVSVRLFLCSPFFTP